MPKLIQATRNEQTDAKEQMNQPTTSFFDQAGPVSATESMIQTQQHGVPSTPSKGKLASAINKAQMNGDSCSSENWDVPPAETTNLSSISFQEQSQLFEPIFRLTRLEKLEENSIDNMIRAIQRVMAQCERKNWKIDQSTVRTLVQFIVSLFDPVTTTCWKMRLMKSEPTFEFLVNFFFDYNKTGVPVATSCETAKKFVIPKIQQTPRQSNVVAKNGRKANSAARASTPSPARNPNKRPKNNPAIKCRLCGGSHMLHKCPVFLKKTLEDREAVLTRMNLCINCFSPTHTVRMCLDGKCKSCNQKHNSLIHHRHQKPESSGED